MKRNTFVLIGLYLIFYYGGLKAQVVSQETARQVADNFFYSQFPLKSLEHMDVLPLGNKRQPTMYAFSLSSHWVLVAGDKRVQPILAYSDDNSNGFPDEENMPIVSKLFRDGQILIHRDGKTYTISGQRIK